MRDCSRAGVFLSVRRGQPPYSTRTSDPTVIGSVVCNVIACNSKSGFESGNVGVVSAIALNFVGYARQKYDLESERSTGGRQGSLLFRFFTGRSAVW